MICPRSLNHEKPYASTTVKIRLSFPKSGQREAHDFLPFAKTLKVVHIRNESKVRTTLTQYYGLQI